MWVTPTLAPLIVTAVLVPLMVLAVPPWGVAVTVNALPVGAEAVSRLLSNVTDKAVPFTVALEKTGAGPGTSPWMAIFRALAAADHAPLLPALRERAASRRHLATEPASSAVELVTRHPMALLFAVATSRTTQYWVSGSRSMPVPAAVKLLMPVVGEAGFVRVPRLVPGLSDESDRMLRL